MASATHAPQRATYVDYLIDEPPAPPPAPKKKRLTKAERKERQLKEMVEFRKLEITDELRRELELSKKSSKRGEKIWMEMCREIKVQQMREELTSWEAKTNRILAQKDDKVASLLDELAATEEMHKRSYCVQLQIMDYLADVFKAFQDHLRFQYETQAKEMLHDFYNETCELGEIKETYKRKFEKKLTTINLEMNKQLSEDYTTSIEKRDDCVNNEILKRYSMRDSTAKKMNELHAQLLEFLGALLNTSLDALKYDKVNYLMQRQRNFVTESRKLNDAEARDTQTLQDIQMELVRVDTEAQRKINDLKLEYAYFVQMRKAIEKQMKLDRESTYKKLKILTTECYGICKTYQKLQKYGDLLLSLSANCRKLQTESGKVISYDDFEKSSTQNPELTDEQFQLQVLDLKSHIDLNEEELQAQRQLMKNFWRRLALAEAQNILLEEKKRQLIKDNARYINMIKSLSKADDVADLQQALRVQCVLDEEPPCFIGREKQMF